MSTQSSQFTIPDLLANWPWQRVSNDMLEEVREEANEWVMSLGLFEPSQFKKFRNCDFSKSNTSVVILVIL